MRWCVICLFFVASPAFGANAPKIAVVADGPSRVTDNSIAILGEEIEALFAERYPAYAFPDAPTHVGDHTMVGSRRILAEALNDRNYDMVVGFGFFVGRAVAEVESLRKPVFLPFAAPGFQGLPRDGKTSGRKNLAYLTGLIDLEREFRRFRDVIRRDRDVVLVDRMYVDNIPKLQEFVSSQSASAMESTLIPVDPSAEKILAAIPEGTEAVYIGPLPRLPRDEIQPLIDGLNARRIPSYASQGRRWVEMGAFTTLVPLDEDQRRLRRIAISIQDANAREPLETFSTVFERRTQLVINMKTARAINVWPRFDLLTEAELIDDDPEARGRSVSLRQAVAHALAMNLDLDATRQDAQIAEQDYRESLSFLYPELSVSADATWIDPDVASVFFNAERQLGYSVSGQQLIYGAGAVPGARAVDATRRSVLASIDAASLDTVSSTATAYLNVLRARTAERINRENLERVRVNLSLAEVRVEIGSAGRQEVFRWENEIADSRAQVIAASAARNQAEIALNRSMNRPLEEAFGTVEPLEDGVVFPEEAQKFVDDPWAFKVFRDFMVVEAQRNSPELRQVSEAISANEFALSGRRQRLWLPDVFVSGGISHIPFRDGVGSEDADGVPGIPARVDYQWQVGAGLSFPIFEFERYPQIERNEIELTQLGIQKAELAQRIEQRVRSALHQAVASRATVKLRRDAADAAEQNFALVTDAYRQGTVDLITLIDAQNQALSTNLAAANALYDFLIDYIEVERASGKFGFLSDEAELQGFVERLNSFALERQNGEN